MGSLHYLKDGERLIYLFSRRIWLINSLLMHVTGYAPVYRVDAWSVLHPALREGDGYTYDADRNAMLRRGRTRYRSRLDRAFCKLDSDWALEGMLLVGTEPIQGEVHNGLPVLPSDHFGLLLQVKRNEIVDLT